MMYTIQNDPSLPLQNNSHSPIEHNLTNSHASPHIPSERPSTLTYRSHRPDPPPPHELPAPSTAPPGYPAAHPSQTPTPHNNPGRTTGRSGSAIPLYPYLP